MTTRDPEEVGIWLGGGRKILGYGTFVWREGNRCKNNIYIVLAQRKGCNPKTIHSQYFTRKITG